MSEFEGKEGNAEEATPELIKDQVVKNPSIDCIETGPITVEVMSPELAKAFARYDENSYLSFEIIKEISPEALRNFKGFKGKYLNISTSSGLTVDHAKVLSELQCEELSLTTNTKLSHAILEELMKFNGKLWLYDIGKVDADIALLLAYTKAGGPVILVSEVEFEDERAAYTFLEALKNDKVRPSDYSEVPYTDIVKEDPVARLVRPESVEQDVMDILFGGSFDNLRKTLTGKSKEVDEQKKAMRKFLKGVIDEEKDEDPYKN